MSLVEGMTKRILELNEHSFALARNIVLHLSSVAGHSADGWTGLSAACNAARSVPSRLTRKRMQRTRKVGKAGFMRAIRTFYHGTTDSLQIHKILLPPIITNRKREHWRKKYDDKVFFTTSLSTAKKFAKKACDKYGGSPIIYIVRPIGQYFNTINGEYISDKAAIIGTIS